MTRYVIPVLAIALIGTPSAAAATPPVKSCGYAGTRDDGLAATNVRARVVSCTTARLVARRARVASTQGGTARTRVGGITWRCTTTQAATGTDPGYIARTKVDCRRSSSSSALVRFELRS